jgi:hypothetical protein
LMVYVHAIFANFQFQLIIHNIMLGMSSQTCSYQISMLAISSTFIGLNNYFNEDVSLPMSFNVNVCGSFLPLVSRVSTLKGVPSHLNKVQSSFFEYFVWCKVITTNIKNSIGLNFTKTCCLGHMCCVQDDWNNFLCFGSYNQIFWCSECVHIPMVGQMQLISTTSSLGCKFCHVPPLCVVDYIGRIYYVVHKLQSFSRVAIHLGLHNHLIVDGKCKEYLDENKRLIT